MNVAKLARFVCLASIAMAGMSCAGESDPAQTEDSAGSASEAFAPAKTKTFGLWTPKPPLPNGSRTMFAAAAIDPVRTGTQNNPGPILYGWVLVTGGLYVNGNTPQADTWLLKPPSFAWEGAAAMHLARYGHAISDVGGGTGKILVAGGLPGPAGTSAEIYNPANDSWTQVDFPPGSPARSGAAAVQVSDGKVLIIGGTQITDTGLIFDSNAPAGHQWSDTAPMGFTRDHPTATAIGGGKVFVAGGTGVLDAQVYDSVTDSWFSAGQTGVERVGHTATCLLDPKAPLPPVGWVCPRMLITGGAKNEIWTTPAAWTAGVNGAWREAAPFHTPHLAYHSAARLYTGDVIVAGGEPVPGGGSTPTTEIYDLKGDTWTLLEPMSAPRAHHAGIAVRSHSTFEGGMLIIGDVPQTSLVNEVALYDPPIKTCVSYQGAGVVDESDSIQNGNALFIVDKNSSSMLRFPADNHWKLPSERVASATVTLNVKSRSTAGLINVYPMLVPWSANTPTAGLAHGPLVTSFAPPAAGSVSFSLTGPLGHPLAQDWVAHPALDYGVLLQQENQGGEASFYATNYSGVSPAVSVARPKLDFCFYRLPLAGPCETLPTCTEEGHCAYPPKPDVTLCNDGNALTTGDHCSSGVCVGGGLSSSTFPTSPPVFAQQAGDTHGVIKCNPGDVVTGIWSDTDYVHLFALALQCSKLLDSNGKLGPPYLSGLVGHVGNGLAITSLGCPPDQAVVGFLGWSEGEGQLYQMGLRCANTKDWHNGGQGSAVWPFGFSQQNLVYSATCPGGYVMTSTDVWVGDVLNGAVSTCTRTNP